MDQIAEKILIVDDEKNVLDALKDIFAQSEYEIDFARSGKECIEKVQLRIFNVVILDTTLPDTNSLELLEKIKNIDPQIRVIMMSWHTSAAKITEAFEKKASEFILKPFQSKDVLKKVRKSLLFQRMSKTRERAKHLMPMD
jgi:DNA-binding NtrC family response regulator